MALHEAGHAKDFNSRKLKGTHAAIYSLPGAPLYYEAVASNDALSYLQHECRYDDQKRAYRLLHPAYGTYVGGFFLRESGLGFLGAIPGHITGAIAAMRVKGDGHWSSNLKLLFSPTRKIQYKEVAELDTHSFIPAYACDQLNSMLSTNDSQLWKYNLG